MPRPGQCLACALRVRAAEAPLPCQCCSLEQSAIPFTPEDKGAEPHPSCRTHTLALQGLVAPTHRLANTPSWASPTF